MLALCLMLLGTYYAQNYASIIGGCLQMDREYCVALVHKQAPRLLLASSTHGNHEWMIL